MSGKSNFIPYAKMSLKRFEAREEARAQWKADINANRKNHVSETDLSKGGQPFHFAGPKKTLTKNK